MKKHPKGDPRSKFAKLRGLMRQKRVAQADIAVTLGCSGVHVSQCLCGVTEWKLHEIWVVMSILRIPAEDMWLYFPKDGVDKDIDMHGAYASGSECSFSSVNANDGYVMSGTYYSTY